MKKFRILSAFLECSSGMTPRVQTIKDYIDVLSKLGYDRLYLGLAGAYKIDTEPYFAYKKGKYTVAQLQKLDSYAQEKGIELVANIQTLAHLDFLSDHDAYREYMDTSATLMVGEPRVYALIEKMFATISQGLSTRRIHIGFDEAFGIGTGKFLQKYGYRDGKSLVLEHLQKVAAIAEKYGYTCEMWGDMLTGKYRTNVTPEQIQAAIPKNTSVVYWNYDDKDEMLISEKLEKVKQYAEDIAYAGNAWKIASFAPNNLNSIDTLLPQMKVCSEKGITHYMVTIWADGCSPCGWYSILPTLFIASEYNNGGYEIGGEINKEKFFQLFEAKYDDFILLDFLDEPFKKVCLKRRNTSFCIFYDDLLLGNYETMLPSGIADKYAEIAEEYAKVKSGKYQYIFKKQEALARVLCLKAGLATKIRTAYGNGDRPLMRELCKTVELLIERLKCFIEVFDEFFVHDNVVLGVECNQQRFGGQLVRYGYVLKQMQEYVEHGKAIEELEDEFLSPSWEPMPIYGGCLWYYYKNLISYNM